MRAASINLVWPIVIALALVGCSGLSPRTNRLPLVHQSTSTATAGKTSAATARTSTAPPAAPAAARTVPATAARQTDPATAAIKSVIQKANAEQEQAFATGDPTLMKDTATTSYYDQLVQINRQMASGGVSAIDLVRLAWGPIVLKNATTARATTFETWRTTFADGSTDQRRDRNVYTLVQQNGAWKIESDVQPDANLDQPPGPTTPAPTGQIPPSVSIPVRQTDVSNNWSGYEAINGTFTGVSGTWTIPTSGSPDRFASAATWVGIGGVRSRDLIQAGTEETSNGTGQARYDAWIETLPRPSHRVPLTVHPGDSVTVSLSEQGANRWLVSFTNNSTGETYRTTVNYASSLSSAEWIEEAPSARRQLLPLDNFGTVQFSRATAIENGQTVTIAQASGQPITMITFQGIPIASPSALTADGAGFTITRVTSSRSEPLPQRGFRPGRGRYPTNPFNPFSPLGPSFGD